MTVDIDSIGIVESIDGEPLPKGRVLADEVECNQFQDAEMFLANHGKKGPQVGILRPGTYRINSRLFNITKAPAVKIEENTIGIAVAKDGIPLPTGYVIAPKALNDDGTEADHKVLSKRAALYRQQRIPGTAVGYPAAGNIFHQSELI